MSARSYEEFSKEDLINWIELCQDFFDGKVLDHEHGALYSVYGRLIKFSEMKNNQLAALTQQTETAEAERDALLEALKPFAKEGAGIHINQPDNMQMYLDNYDPTEDGSYGKTDLTIGDFRKAAALVGDV